MRFEDIQKITWEIADIIRDEGSGETTDYMKIGLPLIFMKRLLDVRKEYVKEHLEKTFAYKMEKDIVDTLKSEGQGMKVYLTKEDMLEWYFIDWKDIINFGLNPNAEEKEIVLDYKDSDNKNSLSIKTTAQNRQQFIEEVIHSFSNDKIRSIFDESEFLERIKNAKAISDSTFTKLLNVLSRADFSYKNAPTDIFSDAYMDLVEKFAEGAGKKGGEFFTPRSLCEGTVKLLDPELPEKGTLKVCDITAGSATFLTVFFDILKAKLEAKGMDKEEAKKELNNRVYMYLQEKTAFTLIMGEMNLLLAGFEAMAIYNANTITDYLNNVGKHRNTCDFFVGNPPYGLKDYGIDYFVSGTGKKQTFSEAAKQERWEMGIPNKGEGEFAFMNTFMDMLHSNGRGALILPLGTLFKDATKDIRKAYIEKDWVEGLVLLPDSMFTTTSIPVVIWIFNKNKSEKDKNKIFMINSSEEYEKVGKFNVWNQEASLDAYLERKQYTDFSSYVSIDTIRENDYNLSVQRYVYKEEQEEEIDIAKVMKESTDVEAELAENKAFMDDVFGQIIALRG